MANVKTKETTTSTPSFSVNVEEISYEKPLLEVGVYAAQIINARIVGKEDKQYLNIAKETKWNKEAVNDNSNKPGAFIETGDWIVVGELYFDAAYLSKKAAQVLQQDDPKIFGGKLKLAFTKDNYTLDLKNNISFFNWLKALNISIQEVQQNVDFSYDENITIPKELQDVPNVLLMLNSLTYYKALLNLICNMANLTKVRVNISRVPNFRDTSILMNKIDCGEWNTKAGILPYVEGCEEDLG